MRILIAEDSTLFREGLARLLVEAGHEIVASVGDARALIEAVAEHRPEFAIIDVRMPPTMTTDGARAARQIRSTHPDLPILLLSQHVETRQSLSLVATGNFGYLLNDCRVSTCWLSSRIGRSGWVERICRAARAPSVVMVGGIRTSMIANSGRCSATASIRARASPTDATISWPASTSRRASPSRNSVESSAIRMRIRFSP